jgi:2-isopropylmalate synthase
LSAQSPRRVLILDTTLRDGAQSPGVSFTVKDKVRIAEALDSLRVDIIEAGNPGGNPKDAAFFADPPQMRGAKLAAFGATRRAGVSAEIDANLSALLHAKTDTLVLFGKASTFHVDEILRADLGENLLMIEDSIRFLVSLGRTVHFDAEHFFDGYDIDEDYALEVVRTAARAGAASVALCDTNGGELPWRVAEAVRIVARTVDVPVAIHCHNDGGTAVASTLLAVRAGADIVHGTFAGLGERCGNADLCSVLPTLMYKMGVETSCADTLNNLTTTARLIADAANLELPRNMPYVGAEAFAHKGGMHVDGVRKASRSFEHIAPELVGNERRLLISDQSGRSALLDKLYAIAPDVSRADPILAEIADRLKLKEMEGFSYEGAEGSFKLMAMRLLGRVRPHFEALDFHVQASKPWAGDSSQAYIKIRVNGTEEITAAEGTGPVGALDRALRRALTVFYPDLSCVRLVDFKVRVIDSFATDSMVRVTIESTDGVKTWGTVGVSRNIIEACWQALVDSVEYKLSALS